MKRALFTAFVFCATFAAMQSCTLKVDVPPPNVTFDCIVIELPGGQTMVECPDGGIQDAGQVGQ